MNEYWTCNKTMLSSCPPERKNSLGSECCCRQNIGYIKGINNKISFYLKFFYEDKNVIQISFYFICQHLSEYELLRGRFSKKYVNFLKRHLNIMNSYCLSNYVTT